MAQKLTDREREILRRLARRFPEKAIRAGIHDLTKPAGPVPALRISLGRNQVVEIERERNAWPAESPQRLADAAEAKLKLLGLERGQQVA